MAKKQTKKSGYPSLYSPGGFVSGPQYIIELLCEAKARREKKDLPVKFWNLPEWSTYYKAQLRCVYALLKKYDEQALINTLRNNKHIFSLRPDFVKPLIDDEQLKVLAKKNKPKIQIQEPINTNVETTVRPKHKKNILDKLEELDG